MRVGSLFSGVLGLDWPWLGFDHQWVSEVDEDAALVLEERMPGVPNLGDVTEIDWSDVDPVDVLIGGGFPCQPFSQAGKRKGEADDRYLWPEVVRSVRALRPRLVVLENTPTVSTRADGLPRFAADLAEVGYDLRWTRLRAGEVGAPHRRDRWFAVAYPCGDGVGPVGGSDRGDAGVDGRRAAPNVPAGSEMAYTADASAGGGDPATDAGCVQREGLERLESDSRVGAETPERGGSGDAGRHRLLPTPNAWDGARGPDYARAGRERSGGDDLVTTAARLLPTPVASDAHGSRPATARTDQWTSNPGTTIHDVAHADQWGDYADAVSRWVAYMGPPPDPVDDNRRLEAPFVEWMMGFPPGWVTDLVPRRPALRLLGNAVVPHAAVVSLALLEVD